MKRVLNIYSVVALLLVAITLNLSSCIKSEEVDRLNIQYLEQFETIVTPCIFIDGGVVTQYSPANDQIVYTEDRVEYMVANQTFDKLFSLTMSADPMSVDQLVVDFSSKGIDEIDLSECEFEVVKRDKNIVWLWDSKSYIGFVIKY